MVVTYWLCAQQGQGQDYYWATTSDPVWSSSSHSGNNPTSGDFNYSNESSAFDNFNHSDHFNDSNLSDERNDSGNFNQSDHSKSHDCDLCSLNDSDSCQESFDFGYTRFRFELLKSRSSEHVGAVGEFLFWRRGGYPLNIKCAITSENEQGAFVINWTNPVILESYAFVTSFDIPDDDLVSWKLEGESSVDVWDMLDQQNDYPTPIARTTSTVSFIIPSPKVWLNLTGAIARQISTAGTLGVASRAIDGVDNTSFSSGSCTLTDTLGVPWWEVDLGKRYHVLTLLLKNVNSIDYSAEGLSRFYVSVNGRLCAFEESVGAGQVGFLMCHTPGRVIRIAAGARTAISICEIDVRVSLLPVARETELVCDSKEIDEIMGSHNCAFPLRHLDGCSRTCAQTQFNSNSITCIHGTIWGKSQCANLDEDLMYEVQINIFVVGGLIVELSTNNSESSHLNLCSDLYQATSSAIKTRGGETQLSCRLHSQGNATTSLAIRISIELVDENFVSECLSMLEDLTENETSTSRSDFLTNLPASTQNMVQQLNSLIQPATFREYEILTFLYGYGYGDYYYGSESLEQGLLNETFDVNGSEPLITFTPYGEVITRRLTSVDVREFEEGPAVEVAISGASVRLPLDSLEFLGGDVVMMLSVENSSERVPQNPNVSRIVEAPMIVSLFSAKSRSRITKIEPSPITIVFPLMTRDRRMDVLACAFWDVAETRWSTAGLTITTGGHLGANDLICTTTHLTFFAALVNVITCSNADLFNLRSFSNVLHVSWYLEFSSLLFWWIIISNCVLFMVAIKCDNRNSGRWNDACFLMTDERHKDRVSTVQRAKVAHGIVTKALKQNQLKLVLFSALNRKSYETVFFHGHGFFPEEAYLLSWWTKLEKDGVHWEHKDNHFRRAHSKVGKDIQNALESVLDRPIHRSNWSSLFSVFMAAHPYTTLLRFSIRRSAKMRCLNFMALMSATRFTAALFFVGEAKKRDSPEVCNSKEFWDKISMSLWVTVVSSLLTSLPFLALSRINKRGVVVVESPADSKWKRALLIWRIKDAVVLVIHICIVMFSLSFLANFLANSSSLDGIGLFTTQLTSEVLNLLTQPLVKSLLHFFALRNLQAYTAKLDPCASRLCENLHACLDGRIFSLEDSEPGKLGADDGSTAELETENDIASRQRSFSVGETYDM